VNGTPKTPLNWKYEPQLNQWLVTISPVQHRRYEAFSRISLLFVCVAFVVLGVVGWIAYGIMHTLHGIPEAYAAWDTGTLLVKFMESHENRWPTSWGDLLTILDSDAGRQIPLRGATAGDVVYARSLHDHVSVDWNFDPRHADDQRNPVTRADGSAFPVVWNGGDPNEMVREYLRTHAATMASKPP